VENASPVSRRIKYAEISYEDCERRGYSSGIEIEGVGRLYSKIFQDKRCIEYWFVDKDSAVRHIEEKNIDALVLSWFDPSEMNDIMAYLNTGKWYSW
jgi:hypothetical protein